MEVNIDTPLAMIPLLSKEEMISTYHHQLCIASNIYREITVLSYKHAHSSCIVVFVVRYSSSHSSFIRNRESYFTETRQKGMISLLPQEESVRL